MKRVTMRMLALTALALALVLAACSKKPAGEAGGAAEVKDDWGVITIGPNDPIKIGVAAALSGGMASLGIPIKDAAAMAVEEKGEILGHKVVAEPQDDGCDPEMSANAARKLSADPLVAGIVGSMCSGGTIAASDIYDEAHLTMVSPSATAPNVTSRGLENVFRTAWNDRIQGAAQAKYALETLKAKKAALIHNKSPYGQGLMEAFKENFEKGGGAVVAFEGIDDNQTDFSALVSKIKPLGADVIAFGGYVPAGALLVKQIREAGITVPFMGADGVDSDDFTKIAGKQAEGAYISNGQSMKGATYEAFAKMWQEKTKTDVGVFVPQSYDAARILLAAIEQVAVKNADGSLTIGKKALRDAVLATKMDGASGPIEFEPSGDRKVAADAVIKQVKNGKREVVVTIAP